MAIPLLPDSSVTRINAALGERQREWRETKIFHSDLNSIPCTVIFELRGLSAVFFLLS